MIIRKVILIKCIASGSQINKVLIQLGRNILRILKEER